jgi:hypothetical protein
MVQNSSVSISVHRKDLGVRENTKEATNSLGPTAPPVLSQTPGRLWNCVFPLCFGLRLCLAPRGAAIIFLKV